MSKELYKSNESVEMYLETVYLLSLKNENVKMSEVASTMGVSKPSCHSGMAQLKEKGWIEQARYGDITLTSDGLAKAKEIYGRHTLLTQFLQQTLDIDYELAEKDACRIEHVLSDEVIEAIKKKLA